MKEIERVPSKGERGETEKVRCDGKKKKKKKRGIEAGQGIEATSRTENSRATEKKKKNGRTRGKRCEKSPCAHAHMHSPGAAKAARATAARSQARGLLTSL
ncbi:hypothetical protein PUN28_003833 [Cardiocondyla obscurior]|uniref:Uncharacterized protein n=1 Tax=Cardiocondyla obscurior TaxID=286306 RepID=A0AAW2GL21_9HYME